ncbi:CRISPR-associated endonuclease Cas2 [Telmatocola sphagniphila]|uniref:CRISPR-associated endoribonuclease Cas2 n=1 Tax=Telmatocola sphagniphila TaxID=1123043 RepID=A0A8E6EVZ1_9BACT|nr:CRISPR-associated endonuclease Cas2 [Telmatocola sphagniphila]QVL30008.1 CRISPR-associated endonuclease Cas2 [Telmatocola sphagniphila]
MRNIYIIAYDIVDDKRRTKVHKILKGRGEALQYSVFQCALSRSEYVVLQSDLWEILNLHEDRVVLVDLGPQVGRGSLAMESWGRALMDPVEPGAPMII